MIMSARERAERLCLDRLNMLAAERGLGPFSQEEWQDLAEVLAIVQPGKLDAIFGNAVSRQRELVAA